ncbi:hypothetical protein D3C86_1436920 [compost metagenome]
MLHGERLFPVQDDRQDVRHQAGQVAQDGAAQHDQRLLARHVGPVARGDEDQPRDDRREAEQGQRPPDGQHGAEGLGRSGDRGAEGAIVELIGDGEEQRGQVRQADQPGLALDEGQGPGKGQREVHGGGADETDGEEVQPREPLRPGVVDAERLEADPEGEGHDQVRPHRRRAGLEEEGEACEQQVQQADEQRRGEARHHVGPPQPLGLDRHGQGLRVALQLVDDGRAGRALRDEPFQVRARTQRDAVGAQQAIIGPEALAGAVPAGEGLRRDAEVRLVPKAREGLAHVTDDLVAHQPPENGGDQDQAS